MTLSVYSLEQGERWDAVVRSFKAYDVYWLSGYVKAFRIHGDGEPLLFYYEDEDTRGVNVVMKRDVADDRHFVGRIPKGQFFDFATPYGYGGWLIEGERTEGLFEAYQRWIQKNGIISEFVRFHPMLKNHAAAGLFYDMAQLGEVIHMDLASPECIWANLIGKNRNMIRKAIKKGVTIHSGRFPEIYSAFRQIYNKTMDRNAAKAYYYFEETFYRSVLEDLSHNAQVFWAETDGQVIAASIMVGANGRLNYHLSGSLREFHSLAPTNLLLYQAALWGCANGYKTLCLGGGVDSREDGLFKFKRAFYKGDLNRFIIGKKIFDPEKYDELLGLRSEIEHPEYFPKYRG